MIDYALVLVSASQAPTHMTMNHLTLCVLYNVPVVVAITKIDSTPKDVLRFTVKRVHEMVRQVTGGKKTYDIRSETDVEVVQNKLSSIVPMVKLSSVTGENLEVLRNLLYKLPRRRFHEKKLNRGFELFVEDIFTVPGVGTVLSGFVNAGSYSKGNVVYVGPTKNGRFIKSTVKSIHAMQTPVDCVYAGHSACLAVNMTKDERKSLVRRRMFVFDKPVVQPSRTFVADIVVTKGTPVTMVKGRYEVTIHILHQRPTCRLMDFQTMDGCSNENKNEGADSKIVLRPGEMARAKFGITDGAYHLRPGMRVVLRDGGIRGVGKIVEVA